MRVLFSPVGTSDPMTTLGDGPMLHIARHYAPDKVVLLLSPAMRRYEDHDGRYTRALELLAREAGRAVPEVELVHSHVNLVHRYDCYIKEFEECLARLACENPGAETVVNVTSGTPAMQQALVAIDAFGRYGLCAVQVETPRKGINAPGDRENPDDYDLDTLWELNPDNGDGRENRCREVESVNFCDLILRDNTKSLVKGYDYVAAFQLSEQCASISQRAKTLLEGCVHRMRLDGLRAAPCFKGCAGTPLAYDPAENLAEYLAVMEVYLLREQWSDYLRALTPALFEILFRRVEGELPSDAWLENVKNKEGRSTRCIVPEKANGIDVLRSALPQFEDGKRPPVESRHLCAVLKSFVSAEAFEPYEKLRNMEKGARNHVAHEISRVDKKSLERAAGISFEESMDLLFDLANAEAKRGLYARINDEVLGLL